jgi:hypothetical protein
MPNSETESKFVPGQEANAASRNREIHRSSTPAPVAADGVGRCHASIHTCIPRTLGKRGDERATSDASRVGLGYPFCSLASSSALLLSRFAFSSGLSFAGLTGKSSIILFVTASASFVSPSLR